MANKHPRVNIHQPGPGVGGHCLAVDPYFIIAKDPENAKLIQTDVKLIIQCRPMLLIQRSKSSKR